MTLDVRTSDVRVCSDQELWGLLNGRESRRAERMEALLGRLKAATKGVDSGCDIEVIVRIIDPKVDRG